MKTVSRIMVHLCTLGLVYTYINNDMRGLVAFGFLMLGNQLNAVESSLREKANA